MNENLYISEKDVKEGHFLGGGYVFFRLPKANNYTFISQRGIPEELVELDIDEKFSGVVIAPFIASVECPVILIRPDYSVRRAIAIQEKRGGRTSSYREDSEIRHKMYSENFRLCYRYLEDEKVGKIVLSRRLALQNTSDNRWNPVELFLDACRQYPHSYVTLWWTERTGCWIVATPEILLKKMVNNQWQTMALAGTMKWEDYENSRGEGVWSKKDREEQQYVATYIKRKLIPFALEINTSSTYTSKAADLAHLRTDFTFILKAGTTLNMLLRHLHPTPAVCGVPKDVAYDVITRHEDSPRLYYTGFSGPINWDGESQLYVSLRCMEIEPKRALLYAGGGLLKESQEEKEWEETQRKMRTMLRLFE